MAINFSVNPISMAVVAARQNRRVFGAKTNNICVLLDTGQFHKTVFIDRSFLQQTRSCSRKTVAPFVMPLWTCKPRKWKWRSMILCPLFMFWWYSTEHGYKNSGGDSGSGGDGGGGGGAYMFILYDAFEIEHQHIGFAVVVSTEKHNSIVEESNSNAHIFYGPSDQPTENQQTNNSSFIDSLESISVNIFLLTKNTWTHRISYFASHFILSATWRNKFMARKRREKIPSTENVFNKRRIVAHYTIMTVYARTSANNWDYSRHSAYIWKWWKTHSGM